MSWTSTRNWPQAQVMTSMTVSPASCLMALVTSSLVSSAATDGSTGTSQASDGRPDVAAGFGRRGRSCG